MKLLVTLTLGLLAGTLVAAPRPKDEKAKDDLKKFEGNWSFASWQHSGIPLNATSLDSAKWSVKGDKYTFEISGTKEEGTLKLDSSGKVATIELRITAGSDEGSTQVGIYKFDGEALVFCFARPGVKERPTEFVTSEDNSNILVTIKRTK
ncbi:MAG: TIGR03067 domain-containing protein [Gemmataceae bacterium]|nr:TIGR03067 domain-containing protein [Gemmataceae bacterium]